MILSHREAMLYHRPVHPFVMPIDLPFQGYDDPGTNSHTLKRDNGERMCMRGALYQPWCHMTAVKPIG